MAEYIEREALLQTLEEVGGCDAPPDSWADGYDRGILSAITVVENQPTADVVEVRHGTWIANRSPVEVEFSCSECGFSYIEADSYQECDYNFCPNCGAKIDGGSNNA